MAWDPFSAWPNERRWIWLTVAGWILLLRGPAFIENLQAKSQEVVPDFFQEYDSARNRLEGLPVYGDYHEGVRRYLGLQIDDRRSLVVVNAHPPTSILLALPLAKLDFAHAFLTWNLISLAALAASLSIVQRQLEIRFSVWSIAPLVAMLLLCFPLWEQCRLGQLTLILLLLITGAWAAERSGWLWLAGVLLGAATCVKLFPGFLFVYFALRGRWKIVGAGAATIVCLTGLTAIVLGPDAYRSYFFTVLPEIQWFRVGWNNNSVWGFWSRLFDPSPEHERNRSLTEPLYYSPILAKVLSLISSALIVGVLAWTVRRVPRRLLAPQPGTSPHAADGRPLPQGRGDEDGNAGRGQWSDLTFALAATVMLLVSPICWEHYLLLMLAPLAIVWINLPASRFGRALFLAIVAAFWLGYPLTWTAFGLNGRVATPVHSLGILSYQFYALLGFFALVLMILRRGDPASVSASAEARQTLALGAVVMAGLWVHVVYALWQRFGLFYSVALDFGIYRSIAVATLAEGPRAMYDLDLVAPFARELIRYYGPEGRGLNLGPGPYPAVYILPFLALTACSAPIGYLIWTLATLALAIAVARGWRGGFRNVAGGWLQRGSSSSRS